MHLVFLTFESPFNDAGGGGIASYLRAVLPELSRRNHKITIITKAPRANVVVNENIRTIGIQLPDLHWYISKILPFSKDLALPIRQIEWSLAFRRAVQSLSLTDPIDILETPELGAIFLSPSQFAHTVIRLHGSDYTFRKFSGQPTGMGSQINHHFDVLVRKKARGLTSPGAFHAGQIQQESGPGLPPIVVIPNPASRIVLDKSSVQNNKNANLPTILFTGRLAPVKGIETLINAAHSVLSRRPQTRFVLAGEWQMPEKPKDYGIQSTPDPNLPGIHLVGHVPWRNLTGYYLAADLFVMPSYYETFGISVIEAMSCGLPVIASNIGGLAEIVTQGETGVLLPPGNPDLLAEEILTFLDDRPRYLNMGHLGQLFVQNKFTPACVADQLQTYYQSIFQTR